MFSQNKDTPFHFIGIGGCGMSAVALLLHEQGVVVTGSDTSSSAYGHMLAQRGVLVHRGHHASHIPANACVVISSAISDNNPEYMAAKAQGLTVLHRVDVLAKLLQQKKGIVVVGAHGKTTTTALITTLLQHAGLDPSYAIGGLLLANGVNAHWGSGEYFVVEGDESDASFLKLSADIAVVTNVDEEHMETYHHAMADMYRAYDVFLQASRVRVLNADDVLSAPLRRHSCVTFSCKVPADLSATAMTSHGLHTQITAQDNKNNFSIDLALPGLHNVANALAALLAVRACGVDIVTHGAALSSFHGVGRRFNVTHAVVNTHAITVVNDYGHHPTEIAATLQAVRAAYPLSRVILIFEPHRYTRTRDHFDAFARVLSTADVLLMLDIYPASEAPIPGISSATLLARCHAPQQQLVAMTEVIAMLPSLVKRGDVIVVQGAGSVYLLAAQLLEL